MHGTRCISGCEARDEGCRGSLRASLACVIQLWWVPRKMLAGQGNVYACAV